MSMTALTDRNSLIIAAHGGNEISLNQLLKECRMSGDMPSGIAR
jgi:hypothetical protein